MKNMEAPRAITPYILEYPMAFSPVEVFEAFKDDPYSFLLESGMNLYHLGRFSFIGSDPFTILKTKGDAIEVREGSRERSIRGNPFEALRALLGQYRVKGDRRQKPAPLLAGAVGFLGYDLNRFIERLPSRSLDDLKLPDCLLGFYDRVAIFDHVKKKLFIASTGLPETEPALAARRAALRAKEMAERIRALEGRSPQRVSDPPPATGRWPLAARRPPAPSPSPIHHLTSNFTREGYLEAIQKAKEYIAAGDIYQVNLSQRFSADLPVPPFELYKRLRRINPAPFAAFLNFQEVAVVSASPERFLRLKGRMIETRPMKGTRPRGKTPSEDRQLKEELLRSEKEKAELVMIVDLERNDLGRVAEAGSVQVKALRTVETYATVFQTTATVVGRLREDQD
ncbi:MAG: anthranilate synthase component I family protein, partial [Candidatus Methylomirabilales bacterium]